MFEIHDHGRSLVGGAVPDPGEYFGFDPEMLSDLDPELLEAAGAPPLSDGSGAPDPNLIVAAVQRGDVDGVRTALSEDFVFATERHEAVVKALGLPLAAVGWGYQYLSRDTQDYDGPPLTKI